MEFQVRNLYKHFNNTTQKTILKIALNKNTEIWSMNSCVFSLML